jgi:predicted nucleotidyltransferase
MTVLLRVVHGSRLYGTAGPGSDEDFYEVLTSIPLRNPWTSTRGVSRQTVKGSQDVVQKDLRQWMREVSAGVPQAVEAAWARPEFAETDLIGDLRAGLRLGSACWAPHRRAMRNFASAYWSGGAGGEEYAMKRARHAVRLARNLFLLGKDGWYDPTMTAREVAACAQVAANLGPGEELWQTCDWIAMGGGLP